jgi:hypothetical protein
MTDEKAAHRPAPQCHTDSAQLKPYGRIRAFAGSSGSGGTCGRKAHRALFGRMVR